MAGNYAFRAPSMTTKIPLDEIERRYRAIEIPDDRDSWISRSNTFEKFVDYGPSLAWLLSRAPNRDAPWLRPLCPELFDLILDAFEPEHPRTKAHGKPAGPHGVVG